MKKNYISFDESAKRKILSALNKDVDDEGYIIENDTRERVLSSDGDEIKYIDFATFKIGSEIFGKKDIVSLLKFYDLLYWVG